MPKAFSDHEMKLINDKIKQAAKEQFSRFGVKKTNIEEITRAAGIAKGSFYKFYESKEILFFELLEEEEQAMRSSFDPLTLFDGKTDPVTAFKKFLLFFMNYMRTNQLTRTIFNRTEYESLLRKLPPAVLEEHMKHDMTYNTKIMVELQKKGILIKKDPVLIMELIKTALLSIFNTELINPKYYDQVIDLLCESLAKGLVK
ncbi:MAG: TetR/AcrR family transcriptional regulator [Spirochaetales bacterium]|nr:TetR/AcrR family transcriptional regulator [Spirochaetales bacterium]